MPVDAKTKYKAKKTKIVFFDIDDTLRVKKTGYIPESIKAVFKGLKEKGILTGIPRSTVTGRIALCMRWARPTFTVPTAPAR